MLYSIRGRGKGCLIKSLDHKEIKGSRTLPSIALTTQIRDEKYDLLHSIPTASLTFYLPTLCAMYAFSGMQYSNEKLFLVVAYNTTLIMIHIAFSATGKLPFIGNLENLAISWLPYFMIGLHFFSVPTPWLKAISFFKSAKLPMRIDTSPK